TDRMLKMFKTERERVQGRRFNWPLAIGVALLAVCLAAGVVWIEHLRAIPAAEVLRYLYLLSGVLFILGLKGLSSPKYARRGMFLAEFGMLVAIVGTLFHHDIKPQGYGWIAVGLLLG